MLGTTTIWASRRDGRESKNDKFERLAFALPSGFLAVVLSIREKMSFETSHALFDRGAEFVEHLVRRAKTSIPYTLTAFRSISNAGAESAVLPLRDWIWAI